MSEAFYDPETNKLVLGEEAVAAENAAHEMGDYDFETPPTSDTTGNLYSLPDLLTKKSLPNTIGNNPYERPRTDQWDSESITHLGHWLLRQMGSADAETIRQKHIRFLNTLDLGPSVRTVLRKVGGIPQFRAAVTESQANEPPRLESLSLGELTSFAKYVANVRTQNARRPTSKDYAAVSKQINGPSRRQRQSAASIGQLNELIGYPDVATWNQDDFTAWGTRVYQANPTIDKPLSRFALEALSAKEVGPSASSVARRFGSLAAFQEAVEEQLQQAEIIRTARIAHFSQILVENDLSDTLNDVWSDEEKLAFIAKYDLAINILGQNETERASLYAGYTDSAFIAALCNYVPGLSRGEIELRAEELGIMDDIWPPEYAENLKLTESEIEMYRTRVVTTRKHNRQRSRQRDQILASGTSISDVRNGVDESLNKGKEAITNLEQAARSLEETLEQLTLSTEGSSQQEVEQVMVNLRECQLQIDYIKGQLETAIGHSETVRNYL